MAVACGGDTDAIYKCLLENYTAKEDKFRGGILAAQSDLAWSEPELKSRKKDTRTSALKELKKIKNADSFLRENLPRIDFTRLPRAGSLEERMYNYLGRDTQNYERELDYWRAFQERLENQIKVYTDFEHFIKKGATKNRPRFLDGLTVFIYQIALLYQCSTGKEFTVDKLASDGGAITKGMQFAEKSLAALYIHSSSQSR